MSPTSVLRGVLGTLVAAAALVLGTAAQATVAPTGAPSASVAPADVDPRVVARLVADVDRALRSGDFAVGKAKLDELAALLPERSLTLLRMQAWYAHRAGDTAGAMALYGEVIQRMPQDRNAAINLAMLEAERGDVDRASQRLRDLRALGGESAELAAAMARVGAMPR